MPASSARDVAAIPAPPLKATEVPARWISKTPAADGSVAFQLEGRQLSGTVKSLKIVNGRMVLDVGTGHFKLTRFNDGHSPISRVVVDPSL